jgi:DNA modification methylase
VARRIAGQPKEPELATGLRGCVNARGTCQYSGNIAHPTEKAVSILKPLIQSFSRPGDVVLDPFTGSGSTLIAAALSGRHYVGIELEGKYLEHAARSRGAA